MLYRQEIGLDAEKSTMAVVVQEIVTGDLRGRIYQKPKCGFPSCHRSRIWIKPGAGGRDCRTGSLDFRAKTGCGALAHICRDRKNRIVPAEEGVRWHSCRTSCPETTAEHSKKSRRYSMRSKRKIFSDRPRMSSGHIERPFDCYSQSRPITTLPPENPNDNRGWYLSLHRSFENLKAAAAKNRKRADSRYDRRRLSTWPV